MGPVELVAVKFPGNRFSGDILPAVRELIDKDTINVLDVMFVRKDENGDVESVEVDQIDADDYAKWEEMGVRPRGILSADDVDRLSSIIDRNSSLALMLFEDVWSTRLVNAVANASGEVLLNERIPAAVIEGALESRDGLRL